MLRRHLHGLCQLARNQELPGIESLPSIVEPPSPPLSSLIDLSKTIDLMTLTNRTKYLTPDLSIRSNRLVQTCKADSEAEICLAPIVAMMKALEFMKLRIIDELLF